MSSPEHSKYLPMLIPALAIVASFGVMYGQIIANTAAIEKREAEIEQIPVLASEIKGLRRELAEVKHGVEKVYDLIVAGKAYRQGP